MNLHEYQAKQLFAEYGLPVSKGIAVDTADEAVAAAKEIGGDKWVVMEFVNGQSLEDATSGSSRRRYTLVAAERQVA